MRPPDYKPIATMMGGNPAAAQKTAEMIDLSAVAAAWTALPDMNVARAEQFTATLLPDGRICIAGGVGGGADGGVCEVFDPHVLNVDMPVNPNLARPAGTLAFILNSGRVPSTAGQADPRACESSVISRVAAGER